MLKLFSSLLLIASSINVLAQDWAPFKSNDSIAHFVAQDSLQISDYKLDKYIHPIQSIVVDTSFTDNGLSTLIFKKGYSCLEISPTANTGFRFEVPIKGQILGDSLRFDTNFLVASTTDSLGFSLQFPYSYKLNQSWQFGESTDAKIIATVSNLDTMTIPHFGLDSIVKIDLVVQDSFSNPLPQHIFNNTSMVISKINGLLSTPNFSNLNSKNVFDRMHLSLDSLYKKSFSRLSDSVEYGKASRRNNSLPAYWSTNETSTYVKVLSMSKQRDSIFLTKVISTYQESYYVPTNQAIYDSSFTQEVIFDTLVLESSSLYSCIIENSAIKSGYSQFIEKNSYGLCYQLGKSTLISFQRSWVTQFSGSLVYQGHPSPSYFPIWDKNSMFFGLDGENTWWDHFDIKIQKDRVESIFYLKQNTKIYGLKNSVKCNLSDTLLLSQGDSLIANVEYADYQWLDCSQNYAPIPGATNRVFLPTDSGSYAVQVQVGLCRDTSRCTCELLSSLAFQRNDSLISSTDNVDYQWLDCARGYAKIPLATGKSFQPSTSGSYAVEISNGVCRDTSECITNVGLSHLNINEIQLSIFPNPVKSTLFIKSAIDFDHLKIYNKSGQVILNNEYSNQINIDHLASGLYFLKLVNNEGVVTSKFIKE